MPWPHLDTLFHGWITASADSPGVEHVNLDDPSQNTFWHEAPLPQHHHTGVEGAAASEAGVHAGTSFQAEFLGSVDPSHRTPEVYPFIAACGIAVGAFGAAFATVFTLASQHAKRKYEQPGAQIAFTAPTAKPDAEEEWMSNATTAGALTSEGAEEAADENAESEQLGDAELEELSNAEPFPADYGAADSAAPEEPERATES
jgi:hypothetical protein